MSERVLFEIDFGAEVHKVRAVGVPLNVKLKDVRVYINGIDVGESMVIESLKITKVLK